MRRQSEAHDSEIHAYNNSDLGILTVRRSGFLEVFNDIENAVVVNSEKPKEEVSEEIWKIVSEKFSLDFGR